MFGLFKKKPRHLTPEQLEEAPLAHPRPAKGVSSLFILHDNLQHNPTQTMILQTTPEQGAELIRGLYAQHLDFATVIKRLVEDHYAKPTVSTVHRRHQQPVHISLPSDALLESDDLP